MKKKKLLKLINKSVVSLEHRGLTLNAAICEGIRATHDLHNHFGEVAAELIDRLSAIEKLLTKKRK